MYTIDRHQVASPRAEVCSDSVLSAAAIDPFSVLSLAPLVDTF